MKALSTQMRLTSLLLAVLTSAVLLSATAVGMQATSASPHDVVALGHATTAPAAVR